MKIEGASTQTQNINQLVAQQSRETPAEKEKDGDADDATKGVSKASIRQREQIKPEGVGEHVNFFA
jgi:hypothetical protein